MKLLHTGDWHLGRRLHGMDRRGEQRKTLAEVAAVADEERVDAILVAGDLLERRVIEPEPLSDCLDALDALGAVAPVVAVIGNHDDPMLWDRLAPYLARGNVHIVARARPPDDAVVSIDTAAGPLHVACLPWLEIGRLPVGLGEAAHEIRGTYADRAGGIVRAYAAAARERRASMGGVAVLLAHLMVDRAKAGGGEREMSIGVTYAVSGEALPIDLDYVALGHVHRPQLVPGLAAPGRYAGAPIVLDFSDEDAHPSVAVAEVGGSQHGVRERRLEAPRRLVRLRGALEDVAAAARAHDDAVFHCEIELDAVEPDLVDQVRARVPNALRIEPRYPMAEGGDDDEEPSAEGEALSDLYRSWRTTIGSPADPALLDALERALAATPADPTGDGPAPSS